MRALRKEGLEFDRLAARLNKEGYRTRKGTAWHQPWADLIVDGIRDIENRTWPTKFRGVVLIHASKKVERTEVKRYRRELGLDTNDDYKPTTGAIIGKAEIFDCLTHHRSRFFKGPYGFVLKNARRISRPIPLRGLLGIFRVPKSLVAGRRFR